MTQTGRGDWYLTETDGARLARCGLLDDSRGFGHGFSSRDGGGAQNPDVFLAAAGLAGRPVCMARQVHGARLISPGAVSELPEADGILIGNNPEGPAAGIRTADCVPVLLADPVSGQGAVVHSGWKGTAAGIAPLAVGVLAGRGVIQSDLRAALGPAIGGCCYQVGSEVVGAVGGAGVEPRGGGFRLDLRQAIRMQLEAAGVDPRRISIAPWCTCCEKGLFFSWRREGAGAGRMISVLAATGPP